MKREEYTRRKETRYIYTHTHTRTRTREKHERHARKRDGRIVASVRVRAKRRNALANFYAEADARCDFDTRDTIFFRIYASTRIHGYTDTRTTHVYTYVRYIHTYIQKERREA